MYISGPEGTFKWDSYSNIQMIISLEPLQLVHSNHIEHIALFYYTMSSSLSSSGVFKTNVQVKLREVNIMTALASVC